MPHCHSIRGHANTFHTSRVAVSWLSGNVTDTGALHRCHTVNQYAVMPMRPSKAPQIAVVIHFVHTLRRRGTAPWRCTVSECAHTRVTTASRLAGSATTVHVLCTQRAH